jgi:hypothetical protein
MAFHRAATPITHSNQSELLRFNYSTNRFWRMAAVDADGNDLGGLAIRSSAWGPPPLESTRTPPPRYIKEKLPFTADDTFANHWWLSQQDVFVQNADHTRAKQVPRDSARTADGRVAQHV